MADQYDVSDLRVARKSLVANFVRQSQSCRHDLAFRLGCNIIADLVRSAQ